MSLHRMQFDDLGNAVVARLAGEVDSSNADTVQAELSAASDGRPLVLDLTDVGYLDSAGLALLERVRRGADLRLVVPPDSVTASVIKVTGLDAVIPVFPAADDAVS
jgi:anti-anti-sigma factor